MTRIGAKSEISRNGELGIRPELDVPFGGSQWGGGCASRELPPRKWSFSVNDLENKNKIRRNGFTSFGIQTAHSYSRISTET